MTAQNVLWSSASWWIKQLCESCGHPYIVQPVLFWLSLLWLPQLLRNKAETYSVLFRITLRGMMNSYFVWEIDPPLKILPMEGRGKIFNVPPNCWHLWPWVKWIISLSGIAGYRIETFMVPSYCLLLYWEFFFLNLCFMQILYNMLCVSLFILSVLILNRTIDKQIPKYIQVLQDWGP
jgi:hypothetical protein